MPYDWYDLVTGATLEQGDLLRDCLAPVTPIPAIPGEPPPVQSEAKPEPSDIYERIVILTQSCDLLDGSVKRVMVCPVFRVDEFLKMVGGGKEKQNAAKADLKNGRRTAYHLLNLCTLPGYEAPHLVADFGDAFSISLSYAVELAGTGPRLRLLPPYREHLSQMFARFYMRVGLPISVAPFP